MRGEMFIGKCDLQNLSSRGAVCETQKQHVAPTGLLLVDGLRSLYKHFAAPQLYCYHL